MSPDTKIAEAKNFPDAPATVLLRASDLAAILQEVQSLREIVKEHEMRLDKHGEYIRELRFREEPEPGPKQKDRGEILKALLAANQGKMLERDARRKMHLSETVFSKLLSRMKDCIEVQSLHSNRRMNLFKFKSNQKDSKRIAETLDTFRQLFFSPSQPSKPKLPEEWAQSFGASMIFRYYFSYRL